MKKRSRAFYMLLGICFVLVFAALALFVTSTPPSNPLPLPVQVKVQQPVVETELAPVGDEKSQPAVATVVVPLPPEPSEPPLPSSATEKGPRIAIVIDDMGLDIKGSQRAIRLPAAITLSFMPYAPRLHDQAHEARDQGHELLLHMPMEPIGHDDPGPGALLTELPIDELRERFQAGLASFVGFDGVNNHMGSKFTAYQPGMDMVMDELKQRQLFFLDSRTSAHTLGEATARSLGLPTIGRDVFLDDVIAPEAIREQLKETERVAKRKGFAVAIGHPHSVTLDVLESWIGDVEARGFVLVPVNKLVKASE